MSRPKPASPDVLRNLIDRIDVLLSLGSIKKDMVCNTLEASAITGLSPETLRRYAQTEHFPAYKYPGRNLYPCKELCEWVLDHYKPQLIVSTSEMNGYKSCSRRKNRKIKSEGFGVEL